MKKLVVMRHGQAEAGADVDANRSLTQRGREDVARNTARLLDAAGLCESWTQCPPLICHSPYLRTTQTAEILSQTLVDELSLNDSANNNSPSGQPPAIEPVDALLGGNRPAAVVDWLQSRNEENLVLVSHQPLVSLLLGWLVDGDSRHSGGYPMSPASVAVLETVAGSFERGCCELSALLHASS